MKIRSDGTIVFVVIVIIIFSVINYSFSEKSYKDGYVQGYGDCFYGNKKELDISKYSDEEYYYE